MLRMLLFYLIFKHEKSLQQHAATLLVGSVVSPFLFSVFNASFIESE